MPMNDPAIQILDLEDSALEQLHETLHKSEESAVVELHHLVTTEMLKRGLSHGHVDDFWTKTIIETSYIQDADLDSLGTGYSVDFVKAIKESTNSDVADVSIVLTVDGYEMRIEPVDKRQLSAKVESALERKVADHNEKMHSESKKTNIGDLREVFRRGVGAYRTNPSSVRPNVNNPDQWAMGRVNAFLYALRNGKFKSGKFDTDLLPEGHPMSTKGDVEKMIRQEDGKFTVYNEEGTRRFGTYDTKEQAERRLRQIERFSKAKTYTPPQGVREAARRALDWIEEGKAGSGFTAVGRRRASQLAAGQNVSRDTIMRMKSFLARHAVDRKAEGFNRGEKGYPSPGRVAWDAWGGDEARTWVNGLLGDMEKAYDPKEGLNDRQIEMYRNYENQVAVHGVFNQSADADGAHYFGKEANPFAAEGMNCANCVFYMGGGGCEIVEGQIDPMGLCKLWIIPESLIERETEPFSDTEFVAKHGSHDQSSHGSWSAGNRRAGMLGDGNFRQPELRRNSGGEVINPDATGGYKAGIPEVIQYQNQVLTPADSAWHHMESDGSGGYRFTAERTKVHDQIIRDSVEGVPVSDDPTFYLLGGGPASGKSSVVASGQTGIPIDKAVLVNADDVKSALPENSRMRNSESDADFFNAAAFTHEESSIVAKNIQRVAQRQQKDIVLDGTGDSKIDKLTGKVNEAAQAGYKVKATYVTIPTEEAWDRSVSRALGSSKRYVPEYVVRETHASVSAVFPIAIERGIFSEVSLYDNSGASPILIGSGSGRNFNVAEPELWNAFLEKGR